MGFLLKVFGKNNEGACCGVKIEEVKADQNGCCSVTIEHVKDDQSECCVQK